MKPLVRTLTLVGFWMPSGLKDGAVISVAGTRRTRTRSHFYGAVAMQLDPAPRLPTKEPRTQSALVILQILESSEASSEFSFLRHIFCFLLSTQNPP